MTRQSTEGNPPPAPAPVQQLTAAAKADLNALIAAGVPLREAMQRVRAQPGAFGVATPAAPKPRALQGRPPATSEAEVDAYLEALANRLADVGVIPHGAATPIQDKDLAKLQAKATLPYAYVAFLRRFGGARCRLWSHTHHAVEHSQLLLMQRSAHALAKRLGHPIPEAGFAILGHLAAYYFVLHGVGGVDETVHLVHDDAPEQSGPWFASVLGLVDMLANDAIKAWTSGYFEGRPEGTSP